MSRSLGPSRRLGAASVRWWRSVQPGRFWYRLLTIVGGAAAAISLLAMIPLFLSAFLDGSEAREAARSGYLPVAAILVAGLSLMVAGAGIARRRGRNVRLWMLGLDALMDPSGSRPARGVSRPPSGEPAVSPAVDSDGRSHSMVSAPAPPADRPAYRPKHAPLWNNVISYLGFFTVATSSLLLVTFALLNLVTPQTNPYIDIVGYVILPGTLVIGLSVIPIGILFKSWRVRRRDPSQRLVLRFPRVDLNDPVQRRAAKVVVGGTFILLPVVGVSSYHGYHFTDSSTFCGKVCHAVMEPQATTYQHSAHARVSCAECHIGAGASWFVKSKLSGTRQVLATWRGSFSRPIPPAITELRPARETCERCHWPKKFFGAQLRTNVHFSSDETNTRRPLRMLLKTGGGDESSGRAEGIHLHMALAGRVEYIASDDSLQEIPWVKYTDEGGEALIYRTDGLASSDPPPKGIVRRLDCMDCHNRPAHKFRSPQQAVNIYLSAGRIDTTLPFIKREAVAALVQPYPDRETALKKIGARLRRFYQEHHPDVWAARRASVNQAIDRVREIYRGNFFPRMKVDWRTYPDNIGHLYSPGCFRCHGGRHVNQYGKRISHRCDTCHTFLSSVDHDGGHALLKEGAFDHPYDLEGPHAMLRCDQCHTGGTAPVATCTGCHTAQAAFREGKLATLPSLSIPPDPMRDAVDCESCHDSSEPTTISAIDTACMDCHEDEEERFEGMLASWKKEVDAMLAEAASSVDAERRRVLEALRQAGPLHNVEATRIIVRRLMRDSRRVEEQ